MRASIQRPSPRHGHVTGRGAGPTQTIAPATGALTFDRPWRCRSPGGQMTSTTAVTPHRSRRDSVRPLPRSTGLRPWALTLALLWLALPPPAQAQFATQGSGAYRNNIIWFRWGNGTCLNSQDNCAEIGNNTANQTITSQQTYNVAGQPLVVTCTLSGVGNDEFRTYRSGL